MDNAEDQKTKPSTHNDYIETTDTNIPIVKNPATQETEEVKPQTPSPEPTSKAEFPFKPIEHDEVPHHSEPQFGVNFETPSAEVLKSSSTEIIKPQTEITKEVTNTDTAHQIEHKTDAITPPPPTQPKPESAHIDSSPAPAPLQPPTHSAKSALLFTFFALFFIGLGFAGGYFGYKFIPSLGSRFKTSADTASTTLTNSNSISQPKSTASTSSDVSLWPSYTNTTFSYTVKYPDTWYAKNVNDPSATEVTFSSENLSSNTTPSTAYSVDIVAQVNKSASLNDWITAYNATSNNKDVVLTPIKIAGLAGFQQTNTDKSISSFVLINNQVLIITYSSSSSTFTDGQKIYNEILASIGV